MGNLARVGDTVMYPFRLGPGEVRAVFAHSTGVQLAAVEWANEMTDCHRLDELEPVGLVQR